MNKIITVIETALENEDYYSAMYVTLALVGTCSRKQYPDIAQDWKCYQKWLDDNYKPFCEAKYSGNYIPSSTIYQLRCSILHESSTDLNIEKKTNNKIQRIVVTNTNSHFSFSHSAIQINARKFVLEILTAIKIWMENAHKNQIDTTLDFEILNKRWSMGNGAFENCY